jgi:hypothetical protein
MEQFNEAMGKEMNNLNKLMEDRMVETIKTEEKEMGKSIKPEEIDMKKTIKPEEKEMQKATNVKEKNMGESNKPKEKDMEGCDPIPSMPSEFDVIDSLSKNQFELKDEDSNGSSELKEDEMYIPIGDGVWEKIDPSEWEEMEESNKAGLKYYLDPHKSNIDPGVPAPLRLHWSDVDEATKDKYPTAIECYLDGQFYFRRFLKWMEKHRRAFVELSWENKTISLWHLNKCYKTNGELSGWKLGELLEEKEIYLGKKIEETEKRLESLNICLREYKKFSISKLNKCCGKDGEFDGWRLGRLLEEKLIYLVEEIKETEASLKTLGTELFNIEKVISRGCIDSDGLTQVQREEEYLVKLRN